MATRKKSAELVFNLKWKYRGSTSNNSAVIGLQDTAVTTIRLEAFKSYLLKNSGIASNLTSNDVKMTYLSDDGLLWVLDTEEKFQIALHAFRLKARVEEVIVLKLDLIPGRWDGSKQSSDVETQSEEHLMRNPLLEPPEWFVDYMKLFKKDLVEEVSHKFASDLNNVKEIIKEKAPILISKKHKPDTKRSRKSFVAGETVNDTELLRSLKHDRKLESKLEKLDAQTKKLREKKQALINKFGIRNFPSYAHLLLPSESNDTATVENKPTKNDEMSTSTVESKPADVQKVKSVYEARVTVEDERTIPFVGKREFYSTNHSGSTFVRQWFITNSGGRRWADNTRLRMNWGSSEIYFYCTALPVPPLNPGESTTLAVQYCVPNKPGTYESYWYFYEGDVRFGDALHCCTVVDEPLKPINKRETSIKSDVVVEKEKPQCVLLKKKEKLLIEPGIVFAEEKPQCILPKNKGNTFGRSMVFTEQKSQRVLPKNKGKILIEPTIVLVEQKPQHVLPENVEKTPLTPSIVLDKEEPQLVLPKNEAIEPGIAFKNEKPQRVLPKNKEEISVEPDIVFEKESQIPCKDKNVQMTFAKFEREPLSLEIGQSSFPSATESFSRDLRNLLQMTHTKASSPTFVPLPFDCPTNPTDLPELVPNSVILSKPVQQSNESSARKQQSVETLHTVMDLSNTMENITIAEPVPSDSELDWERVSPVENANMEKYFPEVDDHATNRYGISENELTVEVDIELNESGESDNNSSGESFCEIDSEVSSVRSGFDMLTPPPVADTPISDIVNISPDRSDLPHPSFYSPNLIMEAIRPFRFDFSKEATNTGEEAGEDTEPKLEDTNEKQEIPDRESHEQRAGEQPETPEEACQEKPALEQCKLASPACTSESTPERLFIFPQALSGYEVLPAKTHVSDLDKAECKPTQDYPGTCHTEYCYNANPGEYSQFPSSACSRDTSFYSPCYHHYYNYPEPCSAPTCPYKYERTEADRRTEQYWRRFGEAPSAPPEPPKGNGNPVGHGRPMMLTENLVAGAVNVASSAINTARSVISMIAQPKTGEPKEPGRRRIDMLDVELHSECPRGLCQLHDLGFYDDELNIRLLKRYNFDVEKVANEILELHS